MVEHSERCPIPLNCTLEGKYQLKQVLGRGYTGVVYLAFDRSLERDVAVKVLLPRYAADRKVANYFRQEAVALARVRHENVVQIYTFGEHEDLPYFVMEHLGGGTVADLLIEAQARGEGLYLDMVLTILNQVCPGLQAVHDSGIVHRDVKPANMLIGPPFRVAIGDFGLVQTIDSAETSPDIVGTPLYIAPELIDGTVLPKEQLHSCDIYSLAASTFELLTGRGVFEGGSIQELFQAHLHQTPPRASQHKRDIPSTFDAVLQRAMSKDPALRHESCMEFLQALNEARAKGSGRINSKIILVGADARQQLALSMSLTLGSQEVLVVAAEDVELALDQLQTGARPDLVLINDQVEGRSAFELVACLRGDPATSAIPVLLVTRPLSPQNRRVLEAMEVEVLVQPVDPSYLAQQVNRCLERPDDPPRHKATIVSG